MCVYVYIYIYIYIYVLCKGTRHAGSDWAAALPCARIAPTVPPREYVYIYIYIYIYIYPIEVNRFHVSATSKNAVGFHNFNLRIFNLSLKSEQINCGCFCLTRHDVGFQCARVSAQQKHDEISEVDRVHVDFKNSQKLQLLIVSLILTPVIPIVTSSSNRKQRYDNGPFIGTFLMGLSAWPHSTLASGSARSPNRETAA